MQNTSAALPSPNTRDRRLSPILPAAVAGLIAAGLTALFGVWTATSVWSFPLFVLLAILLVYIPGKQIVELLRIQLGSLEELSLSLALGMITASIVYVASSWLGSRYVLDLWVAAAGASYLWRRLRRGWRPTWGAAEGRATAIVGGILLLALARPILSPLFFRTFALLPDGAMTFGRLKDPAFHLALANELAHSAGSPEVPFLAGLPLRYHYGMDLLAALFSQFAGLSILDLVIRFLPVLFLLQAILAMFCFSRAWLNSTAWAGLAALLMVLGEDFSFIPAVLAAYLSPHGQTPLDFFGVPTTYVFYETNPLLPGLGLFFCALLCTTRYCQERSRAWLLLAGFLLAILLEFKVFAFAQALAALGAAGALHFLLRRDPSLLRVLIAAVLFAIPLVTYSHDWLRPASGTNISMMFSIWPHLPFATGAFGLPDLSSNSRTGYTVFAASDDIGAVVATLGVAVPVYLLGGLGLRVIGVPAILKELIRPDPRLPIRAFLALFVVLGPLLTMTWRIVPTGYPAEAQFDNSFWFFVQSKYVAWLFALEVVRHYLDGRSRLWRALILVLLLGFSTLSTALQTSAALSKDVPALDRSTVELLGALDRLCPRGEVVLSGKDLTLPTVTMTRCRVPVSTDLWATSFAGPTEVEQRLADRDAFWAAWRQGELRTDLLERYRVAYVVVDKGEAVPTEAPDSAQPVSTQACLLPRFENASYLVYDVRCAGARPDRR